MTLAMPTTMEDTVALHERVTTNVRGKGVDGAADVNGLAPANMRKHGLLKRGAVWKECAGVSAPTV
jgi:hypothetical protein